MTPAAKITQAPRSSRSLLMPARRLLAGKLVAVLLLQRFEQRKRLRAAAGVGILAPGARRRGESALEKFSRTRVLTLVGKEIGIEVIRIDVIGADGDSLVEALLRLLLVAEADRPARYLCVQAAERAVDRAVHRVRIDSLGGEQQVARLLGLVQGGQAAFG